MFKILLNKLTQLDRLVKQVIMVLLDFIMIILGLIFSFYIRLGYFYRPSDELFWFIFIAPFIAVPIFFSFRLYQSVVRFIGGKALITIAQAVTLYAVIWGLLSYMASIEGIPRTVILNNWMLSLILIGGSRIIARWVFSDYKLINKKNIKKVIIYGTGSAGRQISQDIQLSEEYIHVAYIDENLTKTKTYINNIPIFSHDKIKSVIEKNKVTEVLIALPSISRKRKNEIIDKLNELSVHVRSLPSFSELAGGRVKIDDLLEIDVRELLGRDPVMPNEKLLKINITDKVVMVSGAGGSIGSELCRQVVLLKPKKLILYELSESSLYQVEQEIVNLGLEDVEVLAILGSVRDKSRLEKIFNHFAVHTIYHAAAYKHVPLVEFNQSEGVLNNIIGTKNIAEAAISSKVETFVLISTDKAVRPTNTMGATKRIAELILQALAKQNHSTCFSMVRFGNVLDSSGSVIPTFKKQIKEGGPLTVTDKDIVRYFMTIPEAVELVIQAGAMSQGGDVFVLDMGEPVRIYDLAVKMIQLSGLKVLDQNNAEGDIEIKFIGLRPGEKLYEELLIGQNVDSTENKLIMTTKESMIEWNSLLPILTILEEASLQSSPAEVRDLLIQLVPEFKPQSKIRDLLHN